MTDDIERLHGEVGRLSYALNHAAQTAYRVCAETRHVSLGDAVAAAVEQGT